MPYKDPEDKKEYQRKYMRRKRANKEVFGMGEEESTKKPVRPDKKINAKDYKTADGLLTAVAEEIANIKRQGNMEAATRARVISNLVRTGIKVFEKSELEKEFEKLREFIGMERRI